MALKWIIFDAMGVVFNTGDDVGELLIPYILERTSAVSPEEISNLYHEASVGNLSSAEFWRSVGLAGEHEMNYLNSCLTLDLHFRDVAADLKQQYLLALLSNDVNEWSLYLREKHRLDGFFSVTAISGECRCRKPDRKIYEILMKRVGCSPDECLFIDDREKNLNTAREIGMHALLFNRDGSGDVGSFQELAALVLRM
jgi:HAD superfamily hydrolase (TIGR01549 family)